VSGPALPQHERCAVLRTIGAGRRGACTAAGPDAGAGAALGDFLQGQRERCHGRQQRTGLPAHLLAQLASFLQGPVPEGPDVILTGEYTPFNLLHQGSGLSAMFDFGDGLVGPRVRLAGPDVFPGRG
jgi:hygromycin-B 7''-O-kinase